MGSGEIGLRTKGIEMMDTSTELSWVDTIKNIGVYYWETEDYHCDNEQTMNDFISMIEGSQTIKIINVDGTYAELNISGDFYRVDASGNGDSFNHKVEFEII